MNPYIEQAHNAAYVEIGAMLSVALLLGLLAIAGAIYFKK